MPVALKHYQQKNRLAYQIIFGHTEKLKINHIFLPLINFRKSKNLYMSAQTEY
jgi:hypothetical protein